VLAISYPSLSSFALNSAASVKDILEAEDLDAIFILPLSQEALQEHGQLQESLPELELNENFRDQRKPDWGKYYTVKKFITLSMILFRPTQFSKQFRNQGAHHE
jgi:tRNA U34 5-methylaminomethyl-2-thiouridine-forming methyltransferase MnmC